MEQHTIIKLEHVVKNDVYEALSHIAKYLGYDSVDGYLNAKVEFLIAGASYFSELKTKVQ